MFQSAPNSRKNNPGATLLCLCSLGIHAKKYNCNKSHRNKWSEMEVRRESLKGGADPE